MSKFDIKNYLEKIYNIGVLDVRVRVEQGADIKHPVKKHTTAREDDKKIAYITLVEGQTFTFPGVFDKQSEDDKQMENFMQMKNRNDREKQKLWDKLSLPPWFR